jgi:hypothetical protein
MVNLRRNCRQCPLMLSPPSFGRGLIIAVHLAFRRVAYCSLANFIARVIDAGNQHLVRPHLQPGTVVCCRHLKVHLSNRPALINRPPPSNPESTASPGYVSLISVEPLHLRRLRSSLLARLYRPDRGCGGNYILVAAPTIANHSLPMKELKNDRLLIRRPMDSRL